MLACVCYFLFQCKLRVFSFLAGDNNHVESSFRTVCILYLFFFSSLCLQDASVKKGHWVQNKLGSAKFKAGPLIMLIFAIIVIVLLLALQTQADPTVDYFHSARSCKLNSAVAKGQTVALCVTRVPRRRSTCLCK